jgi:GT2 family glycosyltransferase
MSKTAIVILNWNGKVHLQTFLPSVIANTPLDIPVYIIDNASSDDSLQFLSSNFPQVKIIRNSINGGFAKGYNDGLKKIQADYYVLLNSDVEVTPNWTVSPLQLIESDALIAGCQPKIKSFLNKSLFEHAGGSGGFIDVFGYPFCRGRVLHFNERDEGQYDDIREIFWASGACMFIRSQCFWKAGGFDEDFFAHMEEIDLCWRLKNMGYKFFAQPTSEVFHLGGGTLQYQSPRKTYLNFRNSLFTIYKNSSPVNLALIIFLRLIIDGAAAFKFLLSGKLSHFIAVFSAHMNFYKSLPKLKKKRKEFTAGSDIYGLYKGSIVVDFYLRACKKFSCFKF